MCGSPSAGPLSGTRVLELGGIGPVPFAGMLLADLGAQVLRIDRQGAGFEMPIPPEKDTLHRGKQRLSLDLKHPDGASTVLMLVEDADVLLDSNRPGVLERLGLGPDVLLERNPGLVVGRMTGWGQDGPLAARAGHDPTYIALTGALHAIGRAGGPPQLPLSLVGDFGGGAMYLVAGVLSALLERHRSGRGQVVDASIVDGVAHLMASPYSLLAGGAWQVERGTNLIDTGAPFVDVYETADARYVAVAALEPPFFAQLLAGLALDPAEVPEQWDRSSWGRMRKLFTACFRRRTRDEWDAVFRERDACVSPVLSLEEAPHHPHLRARGTFVERDGAYEPAPAPRFSRTPSTLPAPPVAPASADPRASLDAWGASRVPQILSSGAVSGSDAQTSHAALSH
ncbi:MAG TPA: CaiB/BaiF CoA-transferase family protein [Citricoccus sp.]